MGGEYSTYKMSTERHYLLVLFIAELLVQLLGRKLVFGQDRLELPFTTLHGVDGRTCFCVQDLSEWGLSVHMGCAWFFSSVLVVRLFFSGNFVHTCIESD